MKMKRIYLVTILLGLIIIGCNPMEDLHDEANSIENPVVGNAEYTLTSEDYTDDIEDGGLGLDHESFSSVDDAKADLPDFLSEKYSHWGNGSSVLVGYNLYIGSAEGVSDYAEADIYQLTNADYASTGSDAFGFYPNVDSNDFIPGILDAQITTPEEGQIVLAKYEQYFEDPEVGLAPVWEAAFPGDFGDFEIKEEIGVDDVWTEGSSYAQGSGYNGFTSENIEWFISPEIDLDAQTNLKFQINQYMKYVNDEWDFLQLLVSNDYTTGGDQMAATWDIITIANLPAGDGDEYVLSEDYDFSAYDGETIHVAFRLESDLVTAPRWRIESFAVKALGVDGESNSKGTHYMYTDGAWEAVDGVYFLSSADFDSMGEGSGQPGQYNNFSSSVPPDDYLPTFLSLNSPWAFGQEEDELIVIYDYYSGGAQIRGNRYTVIDGAWVAHESVIATTLQFGHDGTVWVPDNTIRYILAGSDYGLVATALLTEPGFEAAASNLDTYGNFNRQGGTSGWSDEMMVVALGIALDNLDPGAAEEQKYIVTFDMYNGSSGTEDFALIKTDGVWVSQ